MKSSPAALVIGIGKGKSSDDAGDESDATEYGDDEESMPDDDAAGADAVKEFFEQGAKKDYTAAYEALATAVALCGKSEH